MVVPARREPPPRQPGSGCGPPQKHVSFIEKYTEAQVIECNGKTAHVIFTLHITDKNEWVPDVHLFVKALSNRDSVYVSCDNDPNLEDLHWFGIRGHAVARYRERAKNDVQLADALKPKQLPEYRL